MKFTSIEKLTYVETEIDYRKDVWSDSKRAVFEAIAEDYRKQIAEHQAARRISA